jgi:hypothetical protein
MNEQKTNPRRRGFYVGPLFGRIIVRTYRGGSPTRFCITRREIDHPFSKTVRKSSGRIVSDVYTNFRSS